MLDFDATLAPIVSDPTDAHIPGETQAVLEQLTSRPGVTVARISGRSARDLQMRVGLTAILTGNDGLEMIEGNTRWRHPAAARWALFFTKSVASL
jgi:trehalose 6-phosphate phosphatase